MKFVLQILCAFAVASETEPEWPCQKFRGNYSDPNHPECSREVKPISFNKAAVTGFDAKDGAKQCNHIDDERWGPLDAVCQGEKITVDFSPKGGPKDLTGVYGHCEGQDEKVGILWQDGNCWPKQEDTFDMVFLN